MPGSRSPQPRRRRVPGSVRRRMVTFSLLPGLVVTLLGGVIAWALRDEWAGLSALIGGGIGVSIFLAGLIGITGVVAGPAYDTMARAVALLGLPIIRGSAVLSLLSRSGWIELLPLGVGFLAAGMAFQVGTVVGYTGSRQLVFGGESDSSPGEVR